MTAAGATRPPFFYAREKLTPEFPGTAAQEFRRQSFLATLRRDESGQGLAEYALILALIAIVAIVALLFLGGQISTILSRVGASV